MIGHEGSHTVWLSHRGLIVAASPEHLAFAFDEEIQQWTVVGTEMELWMPSQQQEELASLI